MKRCVKCGKEIINGINGCMIMDECFECHGGFPKYPEGKPCKTYMVFGGSNWDDLDYLEGRCLRDEEV